MKNITFFFIFFIQLTYSQSDYFNGNYTFCTIPNDKVSKDNFQLGIDCIKANQYIGGANRLFLDLIKKDSTFCDAYFFAGYTYRLSNMDKPALAYYILADSISNNKSLIFKQNVAFMASKMGAFKFARKKYNQIKKYFPESPEGYYGVASTSIFIGDSDIGLENLNIAIEKYNEKGISLGDEIYLTQGILLTQNEKYKESIEAFEKLSGKITKNDDFRINYAYSLIKNGRAIGDENLIKKAKKIYEKIEDKTNLSEKMLSEFK
jgi:tetratricopeptide (TPR) repeat protein